MDGLHDVEYETIEPPSGSIALKLHPNTKLDLKFIPSLLNRYIGASIVGEYNADIVGICDTTVIFVLLLVTLPRESLT